MTLFHLRVRRLDTYLQKYVNTHLPSDCTQLSSILLRSNKKTCRVYYGTKISQTPTFIVKKNLKNHSLHFWALPVDIIFSKSINHGGLKNCNPAYDVSEVYQENLERSFSLLFTPDKCMTCLSL